ncbi:MAG: hypothetical protein SGJ27_16175 [Candidatus Melainabacteria bacterium]|nr:hypothetical protein [Candidatus Melainabacteria bacterium]
MHRTKFACLFAFAALTSLVVSAVPQCSAQNSITQNATTHTGPNNGNTRNPHSLMGTPFVQTPGEAPAAGWLVPKGASQPVFQGSYSGPLSPPGSKLTGGYEISSDPSVPQKKGTAKGYIKMSQGNCRLPLPQGNFCKVPPPGALAPPPVPHTASPMLIMPISNETLHLQGTDPPSALPVAPSGVDIPVSSAQSPVIATMLFASLAVSLMFVGVRSIAFKRRAPLWIFGLIAAGGLMLVGFMLSFYEPVLLSSSQYNALYNRSAIRVIGATPSGPVGVHKLVPPPPLPPVYGLSSNAAASAISVDF